MSTISGNVQNLRRLSGGASGAPPSLLAGQFFSNENENVIYIGTGNNGSGVSTAQTKVGGQTYIDQRVQSAVVDSIAALRALPYTVLATVSATFSVEVKSYYAGGSGPGGGRFVWNATSTAADDAGTVINPTGNAGAGRFLRLIPLGYVTPQMFGAVGDGVTDDTVALQAFLNYCAPGRQGMLLGCTYAFTSTLIYNPVYGSAMGLGTHATNLLYTGTSTTIDLIQIGVGAGQTQYGPGTFGGFRLLTNTKMTAGTGIHVQNASFLRLIYLIADGQQSNGFLWNGIWIDETGLLFIDHFEAYAQNDALRVSAPGIGNGTIPQYDLWIDHGKIGGSNVGLHIGGGFDNVHIDNTEITSNLTANILIDNAIVAQRNQEVFIHEGVACDYSKGDGIVINDTLARDDSFYSHIVIACTITNSKGSGLRVVNWPTGHIEYNGAYIEWNSNNGIDIEDASAYVTVSPTSQVRHNGSCGIYAGSNYTILQASGRGNVSLNGSNSITSASWASTNGGQITFTTATPHDFTAGANNITISGMAPAGYNGSYTALSGTGGRSIVVAQATNPGTETTLGVAQSCGTTNFSATIIGSGVDTGPGNLFGNITPGASPWTYPFTAAGTLYFSASGSVSGVSFQRPFSTIVSVTPAAGQVQGRANDSVVITYSGTLTPVFVPC